MVRVLSCYHFRGQKIGRCDEATAVTVTNQCIVVGIEDSVNVYVAGHHFHPTEYSDVTTCDSGTGGVQYQHHIPELGVPITFNPKELSPLSPGDDRRIDSNCSDQAGASSCSSSVSSIESDTEIKLSHTFATVDLVRSLSFNKKGNYLLCLECRDADGGGSKCSSIRVYFNWDKKSDALPMRTRIAGVSPSGNDLEKPLLTMIEIPLTSPATAVASCNLTGHLASLSAESVVNIFCYRMKEVSGRGKMQYPDFDRLCAVEVPGFAPESLSFMGNFVSCTSNSRVHVFQIKKSDKSWSPAMNTPDKFGILKSKTKIANSPSLLNKANKAKLHFDTSNKVTYDPNDESVTVHLPSITKANRKRAGNTTVQEEYLGEINSNRSKIVFTSNVGGISVDDILRLSLPPSSSANSAVSSERFLEAALYPIRVKDNLGGVALITGLTKEAILYHLPTKEGCHPVRIANYAFTAPLVTFTFDSLFFHALTESGLETYTSRSLFYSLQDFEGFERYHNACPLKTERPCLVGIRPFVRVRFMAASESLICLLACPTSVETSGTSHPTFSPPLSPSNLNQDERLWTIYSLELPDIDMLYEDTMRVAKCHENQPDTYFTLLCELHLILRTCINSSPDDAPYYMPRYRKLCKQMGLEYLKASWALTSDTKDCDGTIPEVVANQSSLGLSPSADELLELGVTYLCMANVDLQHIFSLDNSALIQEPHYIRGTVKLIDVQLSSYCAKHTDKNSFSPALSSSIVDFLSRNSLDTLVDIVIKVPFLRENHSSRLVEILQDITASRGYTGKESVALILSLIAAGGVELNVRSQIQEILGRVNPQEVHKCLQLEFILDRSSKHSALTDVAICLTAANSDLPTAILSDAMKNQIISVSEVMLAFAKAVNLNSESQIQRSLARALRLILESYFAAKISRDNLQEVSDDKCLNIIFTEDERHAVQALVRSYISDISFSQSNSLIRSGTADSNLASENTNITECVESPIQQENHSHENIQVSKTETQLPKITVVTDNRPDVVGRNQVFGKIPSFVSYLLSVDSPGGSITPMSMTFNQSLFSSHENMESYIRLLSLLASPCGKVEGVKDSVLSFVYNNSSSVKAAPLQLILQMFCEPVETAISILISRQPTTLLLYAKEMFGKSTLKWKTLVTQLKKRISLNPNTSDADMFSTVIESSIWSTCVYLHLANTLTLPELEEVLEKGSDDVAKFRSTCKRVELANSYASMVIQISTEYLQNKQ